MSWEPAWVPDGRGGFRRNQNHVGSDDGEEDGEVEEEGEITASKPNDSSPTSQQQPPAQQPQQQQSQLQQRKSSSGGPPPSSAARSGPGGGGPPSGSGPPQGSSSSGAPDFRGSQGSSGAGVSGGGNPDGVFSGSGPGPGPGGGAMRRGSSLGSGRFGPPGEGGGGMRHRNSFSGLPSSQPPAPDRRMPQRQNSSSSSSFFHRDRDRDREGGIGGSFRDGGSSTPTGGGANSSFHHRDGPPGISSSGSREDGPPFGSVGGERPPFRRDGGGGGGPFRGGRDGGGPPPHREPPFPSGSLVPRGGEPPFDSNRGFNRDSFHGGRDGGPPPSSREPHFGGGSGRDGGPGTPRDHHRDMGREPFGRDRDNRPGRDHPFGGGRDLMRDRDMGPGRDRDMGPGRDREMGPIRDRDIGPLRDREIGPGRDRDIGPGPGPEPGRDLGPGRDRDMGPGRDREIGPGSARDRDFGGRDPYLGGAPRERPYGSIRRDSDTLPLGREPFRPGPNIRDRDRDPGDLPPGARGGDPPFHRDNSFGGVNRGDGRDREFGPGGRERDMGPRGPRPGPFNPRGGPGAGRDPGPLHHRQTSYDRDGGFHGGGAGPESGNRDSFSNSPGPPFKKTIGREGSFSSGSGPGSRDNPPFNEPGSGGGRDVFPPSRVLSGPPPATGGPVASGPTSSRPTDPRRRPSKEASQLVQSQSQTPNQGGGGPQSRGGPPTPSATGVTPNYENIPSSKTALQSTSPPISSPGPARRMSSYSSLADNASFGPAQQPQQQQDTAGFRSPTSRQPHREDRSGGESYGPSGGAGGSSRHFSPNESRGGRFPQSPSSNAGPSPRAQNLPKVPNIQQSSSSQQPPSAPPLRPPSFRNNDPRFKHQQQRQLESSQTEKDSQGQAQTAAAPGPSSSGLGPRFEGNQSIGRRGSGAVDEKPRAPRDPREEANKSSSVPRMSPSPSQRARGVLDVPPSLSAPLLSGGNKIDIPIFRKGSIVRSVNSSMDQVDAEGSSRGQGASSTDAATASGPPPNSTEGASTSTTSDPFGRTLDWKERGSTPRSSPVKPKLVKSFSPQGHAGTSDGAQDTSTKSPQTSANKADGNAAPPPLPPNLSSVGASDAKAEGKATPAPKPATAPSLSSEVPRKPKKVVQLLVSELGDDDIVKRAETAVGHLSEVISDPNIKASSGEGSNLPSKQTIMKAMAELDKKIKEAQKRAGEVAEEKKHSIEIEEAERELEKKRKEDEAKRKQQELLNEKAEKRRREDKLREDGMKKALDEHKDEFEKTRQLAETEIKDQIEKAREEEKKRCSDDVESQIEVASEGFDKDIAKVHRDIEKAKNAATKVDAKLSSAEDDFKSMVADEEAKADAAQKETPRSGIPDVSSIVASIHLENKRRAAESNLFALSIASNDDDTSFQDAEEGVQDLLQLRADPKYGKTSEEWSELTRQVTGLADALYTEPSEAPYYEQNERTHGLIGPSVKECIRDERSKLVAHWTDLAEEYDVRKYLYDKQQSKKGKKAKRGSVSVGSRKSILGVSDKPGPGLDRGAQGLESGGRSSNNPYRRARRGNEVRSESELEQIIAEIAAKEAMEKRITHGGSKLPRQICPIERELTANYVNTFTAQKVDDPLLEEQKLAVTNVWSDMEKCIFLDRFLQFPKDFRRIASFLRNKTTKDCVAFYYDSKQTVPYKGALKEHMMRRKRRGDYSVWDATIQSAISVGATVTAGTGEDKPVAFTLPASDRTYATRLLHPLKRRVLDRMEIDESVIDMDDDDSQVSEETKWRSRKRGRDPLFLLAKEQTKYLKTTTQEALSAPKQRAAASAEPSESSAPPTPKPSSSPKPPSESGKIGESDPSISTPSRKAPQKWTSGEKKIFLETLEKHGRDWSKLSSAVGTKTISQIKNFYYDYKKQAGKFRSGEKKSSKSDAHSKSRATEQDQGRAARPTFDPMQGGDEDGTTSRSPVRAAPTPQMERSSKEVMKSRKPETIDLSENDQHHETASDQNRDIERRLAAAATNMSNFRGAGLSALSTATSMPPSEFVRRGSYSGGNEFGDPNRELIQRLISQRQQQEQEKEQQRFQQEQQQKQQDEELKRQAQLLQLQQLQQQREQQLQHLHQQRELEQQQLGRQQQQLQLGQQPQQSALQQLLSQHQQPNPADQLSVDEIRLLLQRQASAHHQSSLSNLMPWLPQSQLLQAQSRLQALQQHEGAAAAAAAGSIADMGEGSHLQSLLQLQQQQQSSSNPFGLGQNSQLRQMLLSAGLNPAGGLTPPPGAAAGGGFPPGASGQLDEIGGGAAATGGPSDSTADSLAALRAGLLNFGGATGGALGGGGAASNPTPGLVGSSALAGSSLFRQTLAAQQAQSGANPDPRDATYSTGVSDAMSLLARAMQQRGTGGDGGAPGQDAADRY